MTQPPGDPRKDATAASRAANDALAATPPFEDQRDFEEGSRGLIAPLPDGGVIRAADGRPVWDLSGFSSSIQQSAAPPDTVNPSLWRQSQLVVRRVVATGGRPHRR
jgi:alkyl sulfatase BDS1-like metallo-beta-lactamase superfamily hydrolase